jgi:hypothetical protein
MSKARKSDWSESSDSPEEEKTSYEPSKHASDPVIKSKGFKLKRDSTYFKDKPMRGQTIETIAFEKLVELEHTDDITEPFSKLKREQDQLKKKRKPKDAKIKIDLKTATESRPFTPTIPSPKDQFDSPVRNSYNANPYGTQAAPINAYGSMNIAPQGMAYQSMPNLLSYSS